MKSRKTISVFLFAWATTLLISSQTVAAEFRHFSILAETMSPVDSSIGYNCFNGFLQTTQNSSTNFSTAYIAQIDLPNGATISNAICYGFDNDAEDFGFAVYRYRFNGIGKNVFEQITEYVSSGAGPQGYIELAGSLVEPVDPPGLPKINKKDYSYGLYLDLPAPTSHDLYVVRCLVKARMEDTSHFKKIEIE